MGCRICGIRKKKNFQRTGGGEDASGRNVETDGAGWMRGPGFGFAGKREALVFQRQADSTGGFVFECR
jgi:hypothetical protein